MNDKWYLVDNEPGLFIHAAREAKGYTMEEICRGICSISTLSRIETGERVVDYIMIEALLERMKISKSEYEFVLDNKDYDEYMQREEIRNLVNLKKYEQVEQKLLVYEKKHGEKDLHRQFIYLQKGYLEIYKNKISKDKIKNIFHEAISFTAPEYRKDVEQNEILSNTELCCIIEMIELIDESINREKKLKEMYEYFKWCRKKEKMYPIPYRIAMKYYANCLYENGKYEKCINICNNVLNELYNTSKLENRHDIFELRAKARESIGFNNEEEKKQCLRDYLTAYYVAEFYDGQYEVLNMKKYIEEAFGWQFIE